MLLMYSQFVKINGSLQMGKLCIECSEVCVCIVCMCVCFFWGGRCICLLMCVDTRKGGTWAMSVCLSVQISVRPTVIQQASVTH
jgi:hypothetical protein